MSKSRKIFDGLKVLIYDIETTPLKAWIWRCGDNTIRHAQLDPAFNEYRINTIAYKWLGDDKEYCLDRADKIEQFDALVKQADIVIGKNSDNFDVKHINSQRLMQGLDPMPQWLDISDDLEKQMRRYFIFPSMSLDYISGIFGLGGKVKMEFSDWTDIENWKQLEAIESVGVVAGKLQGISILLFKQSAKTIKRLGKIAWKKMIHYNKKDVKDTEAILIRVAPHVKLRHNRATEGEGQKRSLNGGFIPKCRTCGSENVVKTKKITAGQTRYQQFYCRDHNGYAGRATYKWVYNYKPSRGHYAASHEKFGKIS